MKKYSLPVRVAALLCAVCLLLTGCGQVAAPDDTGEPGTPAPTAEPAAEETKSAIDDLGLTEVEKLAVQLAAEHLGQDTTLANVVVFSSDDSDPDAYHVLLLKDTEKNYLAYRYGTGSVYCLSAEEAEDYHENVQDPEADACTHLLYILSRRTANYFPDWETVTKLTPSEVEEVNQALARGEVLAPAAEETQAAQEELEAAQRAQTVQVAAQLAAEHLGTDAVLTNVVDYSIDDFDGAPCHVLLLRNADDRFLAYSYDTETVYCPSSDEVWNYQNDDSSTEEGRCIYLLRVFANRVDFYLRDTETRIELTAAEIAKANWTLVQGDAAAQGETEAAQLAARLAAEHWGQDAALTDAAELSTDVEGTPCHGLLLKSANDEFLAYSYGTEAVYSLRSEEVMNYPGDCDLSTEEGRCAYLLLSFAAHTENDGSSEETWTELTAAEIAKVNRALALGNVPAAEPAAAEVATTLPADAALPEGSGAYKVLDECPEEFSRRELSDEEIQSLVQGDLETAQKRISTGGDFAAWLAALGGQFCSGVTSDGVKQKTIGADFSFVWVRQMIDSNISASLAVRVLGDDLPGIGIVAARVAENDGTFLYGNLIPAEDGGYYLISFDALTDEWEAAVEAGMRPEAFLPIWVDGYAGIAAWCQSADNPRSSTLTQAFYIPGDQEVVLDYKDELYTPRSPWGIQEFFRDEALTANLAEQKVAHIQPENIGNFVLSTKLGGTTLTPEEAYALLDMEPEQVKKRVKTAADVLMLMLAGQYGDCHGDKAKVIDGQEWHYNLNAFQVMQTRTTNCGSAANLANYLLEGDYEEIGFILHAYYIGNGGGHVYNYFKYQGKYYIVDFSWYMFNNYQPENDFPVMELDRLEDYGSRIPELYGGVCMALAHTSPGQHYPNVFDDQNAAYAIPEGVEYELLHQETGSNCYILKEYPLDKSQLDWTTFGEP